MPSDLLHQALGQASKEMGFYWECNKMREIGILYTPENIRAIAEKRKWMTRRVIVPQPNHTMTRIKEIAKRPRYRVGDILYVKEAYRVVSLIEKNCDGTMTFDIGYKDDTFKRKRAIEPSNKPAGEWYSPMFMPKWAARPELKRRVTNVKVERVQDISPSDCEEEGITGQTLSVPGCGQPYEQYRNGDGLVYTDPKDAFRALWDDISAKPKPVRHKGVITHYVSYPWEDIHETREYRGKPWYVCGNPYVFVYSFEEL